MDNNSLKAKKVPLLFIFGLIFTFQFGCDRHAQSTLSASLQSKIPDTQTSTAITGMTNSIPLTDNLTPEISPSSTIPVKKSSTPQPIQELSKICSPLAEHEIGALLGIISASYDPPPQGRDERHHGVDFAYYHDGIRDSIEGEGVESILDGIVAYAQKDRLPYGNMVIVETKYDQLMPGVTELYRNERNQSFYHLYAHLLEPPEVQVGDFVKCGEQLGRVGKTGYNIANPHLHLEVRIGPQNTVFAPMMFYDTQATEEEQASYLLWRTSGVYKHQDPMKLFEIALIHLTSD